MGLDDYVNPEGKRLQVKLTRTDSGELIIDPKQDLKWAKHPVLITKGEDKISDSVPDHRVLVELTGFSTAELTSTFDINSEL